MLQRSLVYLVQEPDHEPQIDSGTRPLDLCHRFET